MQIFNVALTISHFNSVSSVLVEEGKGVFSHHCFFHFIFMQE